MAAPYITLPDKIDRAIVAYLIGEGLGNSENIVPALWVNDRLVSDDGLVTVRADNGRPEDVGTGNYRFTVLVQFTAPIKAHPDDADPYSALTAFRARQGEIFDALLKSDDECTLNYTATQITTAGQAMAVSDGSAEGDAYAARNADMADFTLLWWQPDGFSTPVQKDGLATVTAHFEAVACAADVT